MHLSSKGRLVKNHVVHNYSDDILAFYNQLISMPNHTMISLRDFFSNVVQVNINTVYIVCCDISRLHFILSVLTTAQDPRQTKLCFSEMTK